jgi:hypothetical protein
MRTQPVAFFLVDVAFPANAKFRALARRLPSDDDFNSAVGAFFVALAAARRNGRPEIDALEETGSKYVPDLVAVGLLCETGFNGGPFKSWAAMAPQQVAAGRARAASAERTSAGTFTSALAPLDNAGTVSPALPSPPLPSSGSSSSENVAGARAKDPVGDALFGAYGGNPSVAVLQWGDRLAAQYGADPVAQAIGVALEEGRDRLLSRAEGALKMADRQVEIAERREEEARVREGHRPVLLSRVVMTPDPVRVAEIMGPLRETFGKSQPAPKPIRTGKR